nr:hypothetical protein [Vibrio campbellii]
MYNGSIQIALETRTTPISAGEAVDVLSYREEVPFAMDSVSITFKSTMTLSDTVTRNVVTQHVILGRLFIGNLGAKS